MKRSVLIILVLLMSGTKVFANLVEVGAFLTAPNFNASKIQYDGIYVSLQGITGTPEEALSWNLSTSDAGKTYMINLDDYVVLDNAEMLNIKVWNSLGDENYCRDISGNMFYDNLLAQDCSLKDYAICAVSLTVEDLSLYIVECEPDSFWHSLNGATVTSYDLTMTLWGEPLPEPATLLLLGLGGLIIRRRMS